MSKFKVTCLGGCGNIGSNMFLFQDDTAKFYVDCGVSFPNMEILNINYETPDPLFFDECEDIVITHGHEDHIGAVPLLFKKEKLNIWCTDFVKHLFRTRLADCSQKFITLFEHKDQITFGNFTVTPFHVDHSIPQTSGLLIQHKSVDYDIVYISDFKIGRKEKPEWFSFLDKSLKKKSKKIFMLDSTNIRRRFSGLQLEEEIADNINNCLTYNKERIFVALFSSNVERLAQFIEGGRKANRKVLLHGRSIKLYYLSAVDAGLILHDDNLVFDDPKSVRNERVLVLCTGSQGESRASMNRIARGEDHNFELDAETDLVVFSSMSIPGNEEKIQNLKNTISEKGVHILDNRNAEIHVSGHASREDLAMIYNYFEPDYILPIHGESQFLEEHRHFADDLDLNSETLAILTGDCFQLKNSEQPTFYYGSDRYKPLIFNSSRVRTHPDTLSERKKLARDGVISIATDRRRVLSIEFAGIPFTSKNEREKLETMIQKVMNEKLTKERKIEKMKAKSFQQLGQRPIIFIH